MAEHENGGVRSRRGTRDRGPCTLPEGLGRPGGLDAIEYFYASVFKDYFVVLVLGLLFWAVIKAGLVGWYFMHLKFEGNWVYIMIVPALVLATILVLALMPDMAMKPETEENPGEDRVSLMSCPPDERPARTGCRHRRFPHGGRPNVTKSYRLGVQIVLGHGLDLGDRRAG